MENISYNSQKPSRQDLKLVHPEYSSSHTYSYLYINESSCI